MKKLICLLLIFWVGINNPTLAVNLGEPLLYEKYYSQDKTKYIYSAINNFAEPELLTNWALGQQSVDRQVTNNDDIEFNPVINNQGDMAYAVTKSFPQESKVILNWQEISNSIPVGLNKGLEINDKYLVFIHEDFTAEKHYLAIFDLQSRKLRLIELKQDIYLEKLQFINEHQLIIQGYNLKTASMDIYSFDVSLFIFKPLLITPYTEVLKEVNLETKKFSLLQIKVGEPNVKYLYNAYFNFNKSLPYDAFSYSNDFLGRLSWDVAYRIEGLIKLYSINHDESLRKLTNTMIERILANNNKAQGIVDAANPEYLWASKFSMDKKTPISLMVNNARIIYPMLVALNQGMIDNEGTKRIILDTARNMYQFYENQYNPQEGIYHFQKGINFWGDGVWLPFNQQNAFGLVLIELNKATGEAKYYERATALAASFKKEMVYSKDHRLFWYYWPKAYYAGWKKEQNLSINTPEQAKQTKKLYEDINHAGLNVKFILEYYKKWPKQVYSQKDMIYLNNTLNYFIKKPKFSKFMHGDSINPSYRFLPKYGWVEVNNLNIKKLFINLQPRIYPDFGDSEAVYSYSSMINPAQLKKEKLVLNYMEGDTSGKLIIQKTANLLEADIKELNY